MRWTAFFLLCIALAPFAYAGDVALTFKDKNATLTDSIAYVTVDRVDTVDYVPTDGVLLLSLDRGGHHMQVVLDDPTTPGNDYAGSFTIVQKDFVKSDIVLFAVGTINGFVVDGLDNSLPFANISLSCTSPPLAGTPQHADAFGAFFITAVPVGPCRILASHKDLSGYIDIDVKKGDLADVTVRLLAPKKETDLSTVFLILLAGLIVLIVVLRVINSMVSKKEKAPWQRDEHIKKKRSAKGEEDGQPMAVSRTKSRPKNNRGREHGRMA